MDPGLSELKSAIGRDGAVAIAVAYQVALRTLSVGGWGPMPSQKVRLALVEAMLAEGGANGFVSDRLTEAGLAAVDALAAAKVRHDGEGRVASPRRSRPDPVPTPAPPPRRWLSWA